MAKPQNDLQYHNGAGIPIREPLPNMLGWCPCCKEAVTSDYAYVKWDGEYWVDTFHIITYLKKHDDLQEVG